MAWEGAWHMVPWSSSGPICHPQNGKAVPESWGSACLSSCGDRCPVDPQGLRPLQWGRGGLAAWFYPLGLLREACPDARD